MKTYDFKRCRLIVADIDGTLVNSKKELTKRTIEAIQRLKDAGIEFALASGRPLDEVETLVERWKLPEVFFTYYIGMNGGELMDFHTGKSESFFKMDPSHLKEILDLMSVFDVNPCIYHHGNVLCKTIDERVKYSISRTKKQAFEYKDVAELYAEPNAKILFRMDPAMMDEVEQYARQIPSQHWNVFRTGPFCLEFGDSRINKAYPMHIIAERYGFSVEDIVAFGDTSNDNEMIEEAGWGVCLVNGTEDTKQCADEITEFSDEEEGFADYVEKKILPFL
ncbi:MAG: Cof-type HAD-IIB family hydrolase [Erysipelotrichaceae bacterium]|nr:Cof-type HAD-IIB family hydrolase [Erysipelotrichaceae bacterium]